MKTRIITVILIVLWASSAYSQMGIQILPTPYADRTFQFLKVDRAFIGSPLEVKALVPNALFVIGEDESPELFIQVAAMTYMIGSWAHDPSSSVERVRNNETLPPVVLGKDVSDDMMNKFDLVVVGKRNRFFKRFKNLLKGEGSFIEVLDGATAPNHDVMIVSDEKAAFYLANKLLYFKSGIYRDFFNIVRTRYLIEEGEFNEATFSLENPDAVAGWGKPAILALGHMREVSISMFMIAKKKNDLLFDDLREALEERNKEEAIRIWDAVMETCYTCHHEKKYRQYTPNKEEHSYHHLIVQQFDFECKTCHKGKTAIRGYRQ